MYALEIAQDLLFIAIAISFAFFVVLIIHSLVDERKKASAGQPKPTSRPATHVRPAAPRPSVPLSASSSARLATEHGALSQQQPGRRTKK